MDLSPRPSDLENSGWTQIEEIPKDVLSGSLKIWKSFVKKGFDLPLKGLGKTWAYGVSKAGEVRLIDMTMDGIEDYLGELSSEESSEESDREPVRFRLYTRKNKKKYEELKIKKLKSKYYRKRKPLMVVTYGWLADTNFTQLIKNNLLKKLDVNVILLDWEEIANKNYFVAATKASFVGEKICKLIKRMSSSKKFKVKARNVRLVGYSLGAHVVGAAGDCLRNADFHVSRITGLDPARPFFEFPPVFRGLKKEDARFVDVIHTNSGILGVYSSIGHADFFPNGGIRQPGCYKILSMVTPIFCDHASSYHLFAESILDDDIYEATRCVNYVFYKLGGCANAARNTMGFHCEDNASGKYYLKTPPVFKLLNLT